MKHRFWLFKRRDVFYVEDTLTLKQESLGTRDRKEAERLLSTKDDATAHLLRRQDEPAAIVYPLVLKLATGYTIPLLASYLALVTSI